MDVRWEWEGSYSELRYRSGIGTENSKHSNLKGCLSACKETSFDLPTCYWCRSDLLGLHWPQEMGMVSRLSLRLTWVAAH